MKIDLFSTPIWIGNIDSSLIKLDEKKLEPTFGSNILTSFDQKNKITEESLEYLYEIIIGLIDETITNPYQLHLLNIWENHYINSDFQEKHIHTESDLSFIIYKKIDESKTVFSHPANNLIASFYSSCLRKKFIFGPLDYTPQCRENQIIIFPSFLEHYVKKTSNAITIAGNLKLTFK